ncbi:rod shape-determining protein MreC [Riemerella columbina]|uniref:rod shape-determining protein MreC n=1 Tax=Riemerella columbina TaxID=103810 RepID=UPI0026706B15|nr:rod shape-determining protein MreC [Riemerella columbina]WKS95258.1 rod shape-determining protein MreC [Riemerella columbina]
MGYLLRFFSKNALFVFFLTLQTLALYLIFTRNAVQQTFLAGQAATFNAWVSGYIDEGANYLKLKEMNEQLVAQNKALMQEIYGQEYATVPQRIQVSDSVNAQQKYVMIDAEVMNNSIIRRDNYFTINRGRREGVTGKMGVIAPNGIAGIVINSMENYALVQSVLSVNKMRVNAALKKSGYFGTLTWRGDDARIMHLSDIPKYVPIKVGDTIVTDGKSDLFPAGIMVGTIAGYQVDTKTGFWDISVELGQKMGNVKNVFVVQNLHKAELQQVQDSLNTTIKRDDK